jgi:hypothetical protein
MASRAIWRRSPVAVLAGCWTAVFATARAYWAFGGGRAAAPLAGQTGHPNNVVLGISAGLAGLAGVVLAVRLAAGGYRSWLFVVSAVLAALMLWNALLNCLFLAVRFALGEPFTDAARYYALFYEPSWIVGGVLWAVAAARYRRHGLARRSRRVDPAPRDHLVSVGVSDPVRTG